MNKQMLMAIIAAGAVQTPVYHGVTFVKSRPSYATLTPTNSQKTFTVSAWLKYVGDIWTIAMSTQLNVGGTPRSTCDVYSGSMRVNANPSGSSWSVDVEAAVDITDGNYHHLVWACDTLQATDANRVKLYLDGTLLTPNVTTYPGYDSNLVIGAAQEHQVATDGTYAQVGGFGMSELYLVGGAQLAASDFGVSSGGGWHPKAYTGSLGGGIHCTFNSTVSPMTGANIVGGDYATVTL